MIIHNFSGEDRACRFIYVFWDELTSLIDESRDSLIFMQTREILDNVFFNVSTM